MGEIKHLSSLQNQWVKKVLALKEKARERKKEGRFVLEGKRELSLALTSQFEIQTLFFQEDIMPKETVLKLLGPSKAQPSIFSVSKDVYQKIAYRETTEGVLAIAKTKETGLEKLRFNTKNPLVLVAEAPEKPGNIGALLRTADAANLDAVIIANPKGDLYNPNIIRSSVGCLFTNQVATGSTPAVIAFLKHHGMALYSAALSASLPYTQMDFTAASAIIVGTEATGLSDEWLSNSDQNIIIPMLGQIDSMNVSVSAAIIIYEALRQRGF